MNPDPITVAVFGSSGITQESDAARQAEALGHHLAAAGFIVATGGYMGVMEACSRGARQADGDVIGVTCEAFQDRTPNPYITREIRTPHLNDRITTLMRIADAYVVMDGMIGTLAELFLAWNLVYMGDTKPLIVVGDPLRQAIEALREYTEISEAHTRFLVFCPDVESVTPRLQSLLQG